MSERAADGDRRTAEPAAPDEVYSVRYGDPDGRLREGPDLDPEDERLVDELMAALVGLRDAERRIAEASRRYMRLGSSDMRAIHYVIVCGNRGATATPGGIAKHLGISTASTTKLLDRLQAAGHIQRVPHPTDRRALAIEVSAETRAAAVATMGRQQARRVHAAMRLGRSERELVTRFLRDMARELTMGMEEWAPSDSGAPGASAPDAGAARRRGPGRLPPAH